MFLNEKLFKKNIMHYSLKMYKISYSISICLQINAGKWKQDS